LKDYYYT